MSVPNYTNLSKNFFHDHSSKFDLSTNEGCGKYTEAFVKSARNLDPRIGHLKKNPSQTQYNGHANDAVLYPTGVSSIDGEIYHAVDIIARAEQKKPWCDFVGQGHKNEMICNDPPEGQWNEDHDTEYHSKDWLAEPQTPEIPKPSFPGYEELGGDQTARELLGKLLALDYAGKNRLMDDGTVVWIFRTLYDAIQDVIVNKAEPKKAILKSIDKHRPEWRKELGYQD